jgi:hypothetical protein
MQGERHVGSLTLCSWQFWQFWHNAMSQRDSHGVLHAGAVTCWGLGSFKVSGAFMPCCKAVGQLVHAVFVGAQLNVMCHNVT